MPNYDHPYYQRNHERNLIVLCADWIRRKIEDDG